MPAACVPLEVAHQINVHISSSFVCFVYSPNRIGTLAFVMRCVTVVFCRR